MLASIMISLQRQGELLQSVPPLRCAVIFGGFHNKARLKVNKLAQRVFRLPIDVPSLHCVGDRDPIRAVSCPNEVFLMQIHYYYYYAITFQFVLYY